MKTGILGAVESYSVGLKRTPMFILHNIWFVNQFQILMDQFYCFILYKVFQFGKGRGQTASSLFEYHSCNLLTWKT